MYNRLPTREFVRVENIRLVFKPDLTAAFGVNKRKVDADLSAACEAQSWYSELSEEHSNPDSDFCTNFLTSIL